MTTEARNGYIRVSIMVLAFIAAYTFEVEGYIWVGLLLMVGFQLVNGEGFEE